MRFETVFLILLFSAVACSYTLWAMKFCYSLTLRMMSLPCDLLIFSWRRWHWQFHFWTFLIDTFLASHDSLSTSWFAEFPSRFSLPIPQSFIDNLTIIIIRTINNDFIKTFRQTSQNFLKVPTEFSLKIIMNHRWF